jgi:hypothetical protein
MKEVQKLRKLHKNSSFVAGMVALTTSCPLGFNLWWVSCDSCFVHHILPLLPFVLALIYRIETVSIHSFCVGVIYNVSWAFPPKKFTQFLMRSQIKSNCELGFQNWCFPFPFDFLSIVFELGYDPLEVAPLLPCDRAYQVSWKLVLIWP